MEFDLSPMKRRSIRLITDLVLAVTIGSVVFSVMIFLMIRRALFLPIEEMTRHIGEIADGRTEATADGQPMDLSVKMPEFASAEMRALAHEVDRACRVQHPA
jgi:methyl-accepting chemotaxis protein